jgi:ABC-type taurine transport system ATPase subunit
VGPKSCSTAYLLSISEPLTPLDSILRYERLQRTLWIMYWQEEDFNPRIIFLLKHETSISFAWVRYTTT